MNDKPQKPFRVRKGRSARELKVVERRGQVVQLRKQALPLREIAKRLGVSHETIRKDLKEGLEELKKDAIEGFEEYRQMQVERRESIIAAALPIATDPTHDNWRQAASVVHENEAAIAKLMGTDQPTQIEQKTQHTGGGEMQPLVIEVLPSGIDRAKVVDMQPAETEKPSEITSDGDTDTAT